MHPQKLSMLRLDPEQLDQSIRLGAAVFFKSTILKGLANDFFILDETSSIAKSSKALSTLILAKTGWHVSGLAKLYENSVALPLVNFGGNVWTSSDAEMLLEIKKHIEDAGEIMCSGSPEDAIHSKLDVIAATYPINKRASVVTSNTLVQAVVELAHQDEEEAKGNAILLGRGSPPLEIPTKARLSGSKIRKRNPYQYLGGIITGFDVSLSIVNIEGKHRLKVPLDKMHLIKVGELLETQARQVGKVTFNVYECAPDIEVRSVPDPQYHIDMTAANKDEQ